jgi:hypothetical protein
MKFKEGDILEFDGNGTYSAKKGATATCTGYSDNGEYVKVIWNIDEFWNGQDDGGYNEWQFTKIGEVKNIV